MSLGTTSSPIGTHNIRNSFSVARSGENIVDVIGGKRHRARKWKQGAELRGLAARKEGHGQRRRRLHSVQSSSPLIQYGGLSVYVEYMNKTTNAICTFWSLHLILLGKWADPSPGCGCVAKFKDVLLSRLKGKRRERVRMRTQMSRSEREACPKPAHSGAATRSIVFYDTYLIMFENSQYIL